MDDGHREYGQVLLPAIIDERARRTPDRMLLSLARTARMEDGFEDLSYGRFAQAVDRCAFWLEERVGRREQAAEAKAIFASLPRHDLRAILLIMAAPKTGHQLFWCPPWGTADEMLAALERMDCDVCLRPTPCPEIVEVVLRQHPLRTVVAIPPLETWLRPRYEPDVPAYPYEKDLAKIGTRPFNVFQTSGSTGPPKPIVVRAAANSGIDNFHRLPRLGHEPCVFSHLTGKRVLSTFGWYQYGGFLTSMIGPVLFDFVGVMAPALDDWSAEHIAEAIRCGGVTACIMFPAHCVDFALDAARLLPALRATDLVVFGGSAIPRWAGDALRAHTRVAQIFGSTETSMFPLEVPRRPDEWPYLRLHPQAGLAFRPHLGLLHRQPVVVRRPDLPGWQPVFANFPALDEYPTGDLVEAHPSDPNLWLPVGRIVDLFTLPDGRQFNPVPIEAAIAEHPAVLLAMVYGVAGAGTGGGGLVLLVTPRDRGRPDAESEPGSESESESESLVRLVWPTVRRSFEARAPQWAVDVLDDGLVAVTEAGRPIQRTGAKWNVNRERTAALHHDALEAAYGPITVGFRRRGKLGRY